MENLSQGILSTIIYAVLGIAIAGILLVVLDLLLPGNLRKQLAEGHVTLAILAGSVIIGVCLIVAASIV